MATSNLLEPKNAIDIIKQAIGYRIVDDILRDSELTSIRDLHGRLIAEPVRAPLPQPLNLRSTLDGYAISLDDVVNASEYNPIALRVAGYSRIGDSTVYRIEPGTCIYVDTGAIVPIGADAVIPVENTRLEDDRVIIYKAPPLGDGLALPASDVSSGDLILHIGSRVTPAVIASLASLGYASIKASRRVRVALLSTGGELLEPGSKFEPGRVYDANRYYLNYIFKIMGYDVLDLGIIGDSLDDTINVLEKASRLADIIVLNGGTSVGIRDYTYRALELHGKIIVRGLRVKPGKPTVVGLVRDKLVIGLPGNPRAVINVTESFVIPLLDSLGLPVASSKSEDIDAILALGVKLDPRRRLDLPLATVKSSMGVIAFPVAVESYMVAGLPKADSHVVLESGGYIEAFTRIKAKLLREPCKTIISLVDNKLLDLGKYNARVLYIAADENTANNIIDALANSNTLIVTSDILNIKRNYRILEEAKREIILAKRGECKRIAAYKLYHNIAQRVGARRVIETSRAESAQILYEQGYVDCTIIPEEYKPSEGKIEHIRDETIVLAQLVS
ncbi:MAG: molybdopterin molybdotransferase MoeA [Acidilobaceae archaeon]